LGGYRTGVVGYIMREVAVMIGMIYVLV